MVKGRVPRVAEQPLWESTPGKEIVDADFRPPWGTAVLVHSPSGFGVELPDSGRSWQSRGPDLAFIRWTPEGRLLLVPSRTGDDAPKDDSDFARIVDVEGKQAKLVFLGDAIQNVLVSRKGEIWVGYFDEGVFGYGPHSSDGLVRFSADGERLWGYHSSLRQQVPIIDDCYATCLDPLDGVWMCAYMSFDLVHLDSRGGLLDVIPTPSELHGASALQVLGPNAVFVAPWGLHDDRAVGPTTSEDMRRLRSVFWWKIRGRKFFALPLKPGYFRPVLPESGYAFVRTTNRAVTGISIGSV